MRSTSFAFFLLPGVNGLCEFRVARVKVDERIDYLTLSGFSRRVSVKDCRFFDPHWGLTLWATVPIINLASDAIEETE